MLEIIFSAVADAVIGKALDVALAPLNLDERLSKRVKGDPAKLAFQKALARAYTGFVRSYPELGPQLFTEPFLANEAAPELAALTVGREPDPVHFAHLWVETPRHHITSRALVDASGKLTNLAVDAAQHFLHLLRAELRHDEVFRPIFDSQALDHLPEIADSLDDLNKSLQQALKEAEGYNTRIQGNVDTGGGDFVARDKVITNYYFTGNYAKLELFYDPPDYIYNRVEVDSFVGRRQLQEQIQQFIHAEDRDNGLLLIEGEAGLGKTALMAHLVREYGYFHVFGDRFNGEGKRSEAVAHLAAQIISRFQIEGYHDGVSLEIAQSSRFLQRVLEAAAAKLSHGERIVLVYDALDQAGLPTQDHNPLGLPMALPKGVFIIASQRPVQQPPKCDVLRELIKLEARDPNNLDDIREFLRTKAANDRKITLKLGSYSADNFVQILSERASGNWMYLYFVLAEIERGSRGNPLALDKLPSGLNAYYCEYWQRWRMDASARIKPEWAQIYAPVLGVLGAVDEPISLEQLLDWTGLHAQGTSVEELLARDWRAFVMEQSEQADGRPASQPKYQFVHRSLTRLIRGEVEDGLPTQEQRFIQILAQHTERAHQAIVDHFRAHCGGHWEQLVIDSYARRNLSRHLFEVERGTLFEMVAMSDAWAKAREKREESYTGYLVDLDYAWRYADQFEWKGLGDQIRCALIKSSIHALANNFSPELLRLLLIKKYWSSSKVLYMVFQISDEKQRSEAFVELFPLLPDLLKNETFEAISNLKVDSHKALCLERLARHFDETQRLSVFAVSKCIRDKYDRAKVLLSLLPYLDEVRKVNATDDLLAAARDIVDESQRAQVLVDAIRYLDGTPKLDTVNEVTTLAKRMKDTLVWSSIIPDLFEYLNAIQKSELLDFIVESARTSGDTYILYRLAKKLDGEQKSNILNLEKEIQDKKKATLDQKTHSSTYLLTKPQIESIETALMVAREINDTATRANLMSRLAQLIHGMQRKEAIKETLTLVEQLQHNRHASSLLANLSTILDDSTTTEALLMVKSFTDNSQRAAGLVALVPCLSENQKLEVFEIVSTINQNIAKESSDLAQIEENITVESNRADLLVTLAPHLHLDQRNEIFNILTAINQDLIKNSSILLQNAHKGMRLWIAFQKYHHIYRLIKLAPYLTEIQRNELLATSQKTQSSNNHAELVIGLVKCMNEPSKYDSVRKLLLILKSEKNSDSTRGELLIKLVDVFDRSLLVNFEDDLLEISERIIDSEVRAKVCAILAKKIDGAKGRELVNNALTWYEGLSNSFERVTALIDLIAKVEESQKAKIVSDAQTLIKQIDLDAFRAIPLSQLAIHLEKEQRINALTEACLLSAEQAKNNHLQLNFESIVESCQATNYDGFDWEIWNKTLRLLAQRPRADCLEAFVPLLPMFGHFCEPSIAGEILCAVRDIARWWP